jgi:hypothetical protein
MDESITDDIPQVSVEENNFLTALFSEDKVKKAVFQMEHNKAPGPDGFPAEFYQNFWEIIKSDLLELFTFLHARQLELFRLNFGEIILLPKIKEAERIQQYRHICLLNVSFKIFTKVATIRLTMLFAPLRQLSRKEGIYSMEWSSCMKQSTNYIVKS